MKSYGYKMLVFIVVMVLAMPCYAVLPSPSQMYYDYPAYTDHWNPDWGNVPDLKGCGSFVVYKKRNDSTDRVYIFASTAKFEFKEWLNEPLSNYFNDGPTHLVYQQVSGQENKTISYYWTKNSGWVILWDLKKVSGAAYWNAYCGYPIYNNYDIYDQGNNLYFPCSDKPIEYHYDDYYIKDFADCIVKFGKYGVEGSTEDLDLLRNLENQYEQMGLQFFIKTYKNGDITDEENDLMRLGNSRSNSGRGNITIYVSEVSKGSTLGNGVYKIGIGVSTHFINYMPFQDHSKLLDYFVNKYGNLTNMSIGKKLYAFLCDLYQPQISGLNFDDFYSRNAEKQHWIYWKYDQLILPPVDFESEHFLANDKLDFTIYELERRAAGLYISAGNIFDSGTDTGDYYDFYAPDNPQTEGYFDDDDNHIWFQDAPVSTPVTTPTWTATPRPTPYGTGLPPATPKPTLNPRPTYNNTPGQSQITPGQGINTPDGKLPGQIKKGIEDKLPINVLKKSFDKLEQLSTADYRTLAPKITINLRELYNASIGHINSSMIDKGFVNKDETVIDFSVLGQIKFPAKTGMPVIEYIRLIFSVFMFIFTGLNIYNRIVPKKAISDGD